LPRRVPRCGTYGRYAHIAIATPVGAASPHARRNAACHVAFRGAEPTGATRTSPSPRRLPRRVPRCGTCGRYAHVAIATPLATPRSAVRNPRALRAHRHRHARRCGIAARQEERRLPRRVPRCGTCGRYAHVAIATPLATPRSAVRNPRALRAHRHRHARRCGIAARQEERRLPRRIVCGDGGAIHCWLAPAWRLGPRGPVQPDARPCDTSRQQPAFP